MMAKCDYPGHMSSTENELEKKVSYWIKRFQTHKCSAT